MHKNTAKILTANDLLSGLSVFLSVNGSWTTNCSKACVAHGEDDAARLEAIGKAAAAANQVVGAYLVDARLAPNGAPEPLHYRERMRAAAQPSFWPSHTAVKAAGAARSRKETAHVSV